METVSDKKKRGRPTVFTRTLGDDSFAEYLKDAIRGESKRALTNALYSQEGLSIAQKVCDAHKIFYTPNGHRRRNCILEQIGRMSLQNNYDEETYQKVCLAAIRDLENGCTVREIEEYIRHGRNYNDW